MQIVNKSEKENESIKWEITWESKSIAELIKR